MATDRTHKLFKKEVIVKDFTDRIPPQNLEAESSVLGSLLLDRDALVKVADILSPDDFYKETHGMIYAAIIELFERHEPIDVLTLAELLEQKKLLDVVGGGSALASLASSVPTAAHVRHYAEIVREKATLRRLISAAGEVVSLGYDPADTVDATLDRAEQILFSVSESRGWQSFLPIKNILTEAFERIDELHRHKGALRGIPTGFKDLDALLAGLQNSDLVIVAGRPSMGKTSIVLNMAHHVAVKEGVPVGIFSLEMSKEQLIDRLLASEAEIDSSKLRRGLLNDEDFSKLGQAMAVLSEAPIFIDDSPLATVLEMRTKARRLKSEHGLGLVVIDYLQQLTSTSRNENRVQEISEICREIKAMARELNVPVMVASQLSRQVEQRPNKIPELSDLRESGSIEQDADVVMFIYREDYYDSETERKGVADVFIKKHRSGPTGQIELLWRPQFMNFRNLERRRENE